MILSYQERERLRPSLPEPPKWAFIESISAGRATLRFTDGTVSQKCYLLSGGFSYTVGQKVRTRKESGTIIVEGPLGG